MRSRASLLANILIICTLLPPALASGQEEAPRPSRPGATARERSAILDSSVARVRGPGETIDKADAAILGLELLGTFGSDADSPAGTVQTPHDAAVDASGNIYIVAPFQNNIHVIDSNGNPVRVYPEGEPESSLAAGMFDTPLNIAINRSTGDIYVTERFNHRVQRFDSDFSLLGMWGKDGGANGESGGGDGEFDVPNGIAVNPLDDRVYVTDSMNGRVQVFEADGTFVTSITEFSPGTGFCQPRGIDIDENGRLFVADCSQIGVYESDGTHLGTRQHPDWAGGGGDRLRGIAVNGAGTEVWAADTDNTRVQMFELTYGGDGKLDPVDPNSNHAFDNSLAVFPRGVEVDPVSGHALILDMGELPDSEHPIVRVDPTNAFVAFMGTKVDPPGILNGPFDVATRNSDGEIFVADSVNGRIQRFTRNGTFLSDWGEAGTSGPGFLTPIGIALDPIRGHVFVTDLDSDRVIAYDSEGRFIRDWGETGSGNGQLDRPRDIAIDSNGNLFVADSRNHRIVVFDRDGNYLRTFGSPGSDPGEIAGPRGLAIDRDDNIYLAETGAGRIQKFDNAGNSLMTIDGLANPFFVTVDQAGNIFAGEFFGSAFKVFDATGNYLGDFAPAVRIPGAIHVGIDGRVYALDRSNKARGYVYGTNSAPTANDDAYQGPFNTPLEIAAPGLLANDSDPDGDALTAALDTAPGSGSVTVNAEGSFTYTPADGFTGADTFTYSAVDSRGGTSPAATVTVTVSNHAPTAADDTYDVLARSTRVVAAPGVLGNDSDPEGQALSAVLVSGVSGGSLALAADGSFTYTPAAGTTSDTFTYRAQDTGGQQSDPATVTITVDGGGVPSAVGDSYSTTGALTVGAPGVLGNDSDPEGSPLSANLAVGPANGTLSLQSDGGFVYTPAAGFVGADSFQYDASDGLNADRATVSIEVVACGFSVDPPAIAAGPDGGLETLTVTADDTNCSWTARSQAPWLRLGGTGGTGSDSLALTIDPNDGEDRTGQLEVAGQIVVVSQEGSACSYTLSDDSVGFGPQGGNGSLLVETQPGCAWRAVSSKSWLDIGQSPGPVITGTAGVGYAVAAHSGNADRRAVLEIEVDGTNPKMSVVQLGAESDVPLPPSGLVLRVRRNTNVKVIWKDESDNETGFTVKRRSNNDANETFEVAADSSRMTDRSLLPLTEYCYDVQAFNASGSSPAVGGCVTTSAPGVATGLRLVAASPNSIRLQWDADAPVAQRLEKRQAGQWQLVRELPAGVGEYQDRSVDPGTTYEYRLRSCLSPVCAAVSNTLVAWTYGAEGAPVGLRDVPATAATETRTPVKVQPYSADRPMMPIARVYKDVNLVQAASAADESALITLGWAPNVDLFVHPLAELAAGIPDDTAIVLLPTARPTHGNEAYEAGVREALRSFVFGGGTLVVHAALEGHAIPFDLTGRAVAEVEHYREASIRGGRVLVTSEHLELDPEALLRSLQAAIRER